MNLNECRSVFEGELEKYVRSLPSDRLHEPIRYILSLGGKRIRPALVMLSCQAFGGEVVRAVPAAMAVEIFHNFSLVHDDIMDEAPLRRGQPTVHHKWNLNAGILSGDAMLIEAYKHLCRYEGDLLSRLLDLFNRTAADVCLGQQYDMDFENDGGVTEERYIEMIGLKTAVLLGGALAMGALIAEASDHEVQAIYEFGKAAGIGFQLQDDYLDAFGDPEKFGKQIGGDIIADKKTYLIIRGLQKADEKLRAELEGIYFHGRITGAKDKVARTLEIFKTLGVDRDTLACSETHFSRAVGVLEQINLSEEGREKLLDFLGLLRKRKS
jgi:geranylgeranyl diphosphate synthase type II